MQISPKGKAKVLRMGNLNDLWFLSQVVEPGDLVTGKTERKISLGGKEERSNIKKVVLTLQITVENVEFHKYSDVLRISGLITEGKEDIPKGQHHTISVEENSIITVEKEQWLDYQNKALKESQTKQPEFLLLVMDRENATFALLTGQGYKVLSNIEGKVQKKAVDEQKKSTFYEELITKMKEYLQRYKVKSTIIASPAFFKEDLIKQIKDEDIKKNILLATCNHVGEYGISEVLKRDELKSALHEDRIAKELKVVDQLLSEISKDGKAAYGFKDVAANTSAVEILILTDSLIKEYRQKGTYAELSAILKVIQNAQGKIEIIESDNPAGKKLDGLGGIAGILRYKV